MSKKIFVVEDHEAYRGVLLTTLRSIRDVDVCGWSANSEDALASLAKKPADLVLVDLSLPTMNGFELATEIRKRYPKTACVIVSGHTIQGYVDRARTLGFQGYVLKGKTPELKSTVRAVLAGESRFPRLEEL